ncbi:hypothetical protein TIFTF001_012315 [Ficus carica]|uniref:NAD-dependent epimerase/dehydratase domain-containing protein n=1 Tax=Ficus carica TaxID=3494 RepID=A0AA88AN40_FICCA|nr:hypothetical protein TIFTF001_012315 [Ficus carica]
MAEEEKGSVCVTGATGFTASWLIMRLLRHGNSVGATVRSHPPRSLGIWWGCIFTDFGSRRPLFVSCKRDLSFLTSLPRAHEKLRIFEADLSQPDSFNSIIEGCIGVFHVAHPVIIHDQGYPEDENIKMTMEGTVGILQACLNSKTVKRVVYTSSPVTVAFNGEDLDLIDENTWSDIDFYKSLNLKGTNLYVATKTRTEKAALEFAEKHGLDLVTILPTYVVGPFICNVHLPASVHLGLAMIFDKLVLVDLYIN